MEWERRGGQTSPGRRGVTEGELGDDSRGGGGGGGGAGKGCAIKGPEGVPGEPVLRENPRPELWEDEWDPPTNRLLREIKVRLGAQEQMFHSCP